MNTLDFVVIGILLGLVAYGMWFGYVEYNYSKYVADFTSARGANKSGNGDVVLSCELGKTICISKATEIHTNPKGTPFEDPKVDPFVVSPYGSFNPSTTISRYNDMSVACNGKKDCTYTFSPKLQLPGTPQLIATYTCVPPSGTCLAQI